MKLTQLDYSAIRNANATSYQASAMRNSASANKLSQDYLNINLDIDKQYKEAQKSADIANTINTSLSIAEGFGKLSDQLKQSQAAKESAGANLFMNNLFAEEEQLTAQLMDKNMVFETDEDGVIGYSDFYSTYKDSYEQKIRNAGFSDDTTQAMLNSYEAHIIQQKQSLLKDQRDRDNAATAKLREADLDAKIKQDIAMSVNSGSISVSNSYGLIGSWKDLNGNERLLLEKQIFEQIKQGAVQEIALKITSSEGANEAYEWADKKYQEGELLPSEYEKIQSQIYNRYNNIKAQATQDVTTSVQSIFSDPNATVSEMIEQIQPIIDKYPTELKDSLNDVVRDLQYEKFCDDNPQFLNYKNLSNEELEESIKKLKDDTANYFLGMDKDKDALILQLEAQLDSNQIAMDKSYTDQQKANIKSFKESADRVLDYWKRKGVSGHFIVDQLSAFAQANDIGDTNEDLLYVDKLIDNIIHRDLPNQLANDCSSVIKGLFSECENLNLNLNNQHMIRKNIQARCLDFFFNYDESIAEDECYNFLNSLTVDYINERLGQLKDEGSTDVMLGTDILGTELIKTDDFIEKLFRYQNEGLVYYSDSNGQMQETVPGALEGYNDLERAAAYLINKTNNVADNPDSSLYVKANATIRYIDNNGEKLYVPVFRNQSGSWFSIVASEDGKNASILYKSNADDEWKEFSKLIDDAIQPVPGASGELFKSTDLNDAYGSNAVDPGNVIEQTAQEVSEKKDTSNVNIDDIIADAIGIASKEDGVKFAKKWSSLIGKDTTREIVATSNAEERMDIIEKSYKSTKIKEDSGVQFITTNTLNDMKTIHTYDEAKVFAEVTRKKNVENALSTIQNKLGSDPNSDKLKSQEVLLRQLMNLLNKENRTEADENSIQYYIVQLKKRGLDVINYRN